MKKLTLLMTIFLFAGCSSDKPAEPAKLTDGANYFPLAEGDTWYFTTSDLRKIVRTVSGDTTVEGVICKRILENDTTTEAWTIDTSGFKLHLLLQNNWADPPLLIPFNLVEGRPYHYDSRIYFYENDILYYSEFTGSLEFKGYVSKTVMAGTFSKAIKLHYIPDGSTAYDEYYGKGVGLLDNGDYFLDSAYIGGVWYK
jgi:hypothetical protein